MKNYDREDNFSFDDFSDNIKVISLCPICNARYSFSDAKMLEEREHGRLVYIHCRKCRSGVLALIMSNSAGVSSVSLVTDLTSKEIMKFKNREPVSMDHVIDLHNNLTKKIIDLSAL